MYGQSKAAGDIAVANCPRHYILRSSWVIGEGHNFVKTMMMLSNRVADPGDGLNEVTVVDDQYGRLTFTSDMADAIFHLLDSGAGYGTYDLTGSGRVESWAGIAQGGVRPDERQRGQGTPDPDRRVFREREGSGQPAPDPFRPGPQEDRGDGIPRAGLGGIVKEVRRQGTGRVIQGEETSR